MKKFLQKHGNKILMILFIIVLCTMCTKNCNKGNEIRLMDKKYESVNLTIDSLNHQIDLLQNTIKDKSIEIDKKNLEINQLNKVNKQLDKAASRKITVNVTSPEKNETP